MSLVRYCDIGRSGRLTYGYIDAAEMQKKLQRDGQEAKRLMKETGAAHVVYGMKHYEETGALESVSFCMVPMREGAFRKTADQAHDCMVYAVHRV